ncbi:exonuclease ii [Phaffia rhodozyma]|uniref:5'-3' exoribonuclease 1 n=1 Tax=Phaffia rhodozyma TaxID=264483 RepID=A0A0F7SRN3_PHARH|nr:exonuclease ii [Phaffia rhodozyma]
MGIPKFFRYISERYPLTSELIDDKSIPMFDNLYLDMNGIIHNCTHPPSSEGDASFRLTEEQMVVAIFAYIEHLFSKIKPQKVFFMAVDGVAPRAKMNQQRSRRFRTAQEAKELEEKALRKGEEMPKEPAFDSNCITPGTPFMTRLSKHLQYFVNKKIAEDTEWRGVEVILSGHDVPGEGEHKIQEYIRLSKAQPKYNPNTRHCLYGLDADLIMLGLLSHDPHFCLLREEVTFGRKSKKSGGLETQNFYLMHLSLLREYLDLEFSSLRLTDGNSTNGNASHPSLPFEYDLEKIIDDFILMAVFVGNDFLPHLPDLHINQGAMELIWGIYKKVLPHAGGYMNESGKINVQRLQLVLDELAKFEIDTFEKHYADASWKSGRHPAPKAKKEIVAFEMARNRGGLVLTKSQKTLFDQIKEFIRSHPQPSSADQLTLVLPFFSISDRQVLQDIADSLHLSLDWDPSEVELSGEPSVVLSFQDAADEGESEIELDADEEGREAIERVLKKWEAAEVIDPEGGPNSFENGSGKDAKKSKKKAKKEPEQPDEEEYDKLLLDQMDEWKLAYYRDKLEFSLKDDHHQIDDLVYNYVEGLQWVMYYYYAGVASWGWYYKYHYAPRISDLKNVDKMSFKFDYGKPFKPFEQLMGVLPYASRSHLPEAYRDLMSDPNSPILDFYPTEFEADMNGKKQEWEAVVKIPFIDETRLLKAMASREHRLTPDEAARNTHGSSFRFIHDDSIDAPYPSSLSGFFPIIARARSRTETFTMPSLDGLELIEGLLKGVQLGASALAGFPSVNTLPQHAQLGFHGVNVHNSDSKNQSMVISIENVWEGQKIEDVARKMIGKRTFTGWPFLREGLVVAVSDELFRYTLASVGGKKKVVSSPQDGAARMSWKRKADGIEHRYSKRFGILTGDIDVLLHVRPLKGLKRTEDGAFVKEYQDNEIETALQLSVPEVECEDERYTEKPPVRIQDEFPLGERVFFLGEHFYGSPAQVSQTTDTTVSLKLAYFPSETRDVALFRDAVARRHSGNYYPSHHVSRQLRISGLALSRITSSLFVVNSQGNKANLGLNLKFEGKSMKVLGYSRKSANGWEYSDQAIKLIQEYMEAFPQVFANLETRHDGGFPTASQFFPREREPDQLVADIKKWFATKKINNLEPVSLLAEQMESETIKVVENLADELNKKRVNEPIKPAILQGLPRQSILKPDHSRFRLQEQKFALGDRVVMVDVAGTGGVPLGLKGIIVSVNTATVDVVWDSGFLGGSNLGHRCSEFKGSNIPFYACLNLTTPQFVVSKNPKPAVAPQVPFAVPHHMARPNSFFKPAPPRSAKAPVTILGRPNKEAARVAPDVPYTNVAQGLRPSQVPETPMSHKQNMQATLNSFSGASRGGRGRPSPHVNQSHQGQQDNVSRPPVASSYSHVPPPSVSTRPSGQQGNRGRGGGRGGRGGRGRPHSEAAPAQV